MQFSSAEITALLGTYFWPFTRISAMFFAAPFLGSRTLVPGRVRIALSLGLTVMIAPLLPAPPAVEPFSIPGLMILLQQFLLGLAMGFIFQLAFSTLVLGGNGIAMTMGLGFANVVDPQNGQQVPVLSTFFMILGTLLFLSLNGHLVLIQVMVDSFRSMPVGVTGAAYDSYWQIAIWGTRMFAGAMLIALPAIVTLTLINIAFGIMTRAAPQLNIFAVGFPTTMSTGFLVLYLTLPNLLPRFSEVLSHAFDLLERVVAGGG